MKCDYILLNVHKSHFIYKFHLKASVILNEGAEVGLKKHVLVVHPSQYLKQVQQ